MSLANRHGILQPQKESENALETIWQIVYAEMILFNVNWFPHIHLWSVESFNFVIHFAVRTLKLSKLLQSSSSSYSKTWKRIQVGHTGIELFNLGRISALSPLPFQRWRNLNRILSSLHVHWNKSQSAIRLYLVKLWLQLSQYFYRSSSLSLVLNCEFVWGITVITWSLPPWWSLSSAQGAFNPWQILGSS